MVVLINILTVLLTNCCFFSFIYFFNPVAFGSVFFPFEATRSNSYYNIYQIGVGVGNWLDQLNMFCISKHKRGPPQKSQTLLALLNWNHCHPHHSLRQQVRGGRKHEPLQHTC